MDTAGRELLDKGIRDYFVQQLRNEFGEDFNLILHRIEYLISNYNLKDLKWTIRREIEEIKKEREGAADVPKEAY